MRSTVAFRRLRRHQPATLLTIGSLKCPTHPCVGYTRCLQSLSWMGKSRPSGAVLSCPIPAKTGEHHKTQAVEMSAGAADACGSTIFDCQAVSAYLRRGQDRIMAWCFHTYWWALECLEAVVSLTRSIATGALPVNRVSASTWTSTPHLASQRSSF